MRQRATAKANGANPWRRMMWGTIKISASVARADSFHLGEQWFRRTWKGKAEGGLGYALAAAGHPRALRGSATGGARQGHGAEGADGHFPVDSLVARGGFEPPTFGL